MEQLGIGFLSVFGLPPTQFVDLAADLGCPYISTALLGFPLAPLGYPPFSLKDDAALRKDLLAVMNDRGVAISLGDGVMLLPGADVHALSADLDVLAELGVPRINAVSLDSDLGRTCDQFPPLPELPPHPTIHTLVQPLPPP